MRRKFKFKIDDLELCFGEAPFYFDEITGLTESDNEINSYKDITSDGYIFNNSMLKERTISIHGRIRGNNRQEAFEYRRRLIGLLNSKRGIGRLECIYDNGDIFYIDCFCDGGVKIKEQNQGKIQGNVFEYDVDFTCPSPYWKQEDIFTKHFAKVEPSFQFDLEIEHDNPNDQVFGYVNYVPYVYIENKGDVPTGFTCTIEHTLKDYIKVINTHTGEFIKVNTSLKAGEKLVIDSHIGKKKITFYNNKGKASNYISKIDLDSTFFLLRAGMNEIKIETNADEEDEDSIVEVTMEYYHLYCGI